MQDNEKIDYKKKLAEWKQTIKKRWWILLVELAVVGVILLADLLSKKYAWEYLDTYGYKDNIIPGLFNLIMVRNEGAGFGIFQGKTVALTVVTFIVVIALTIYLVFALKESEWLRISLVFIIGGGIGNIVDRIALGYVRDFIQFAFWEDFPTFNVADSFVTIGAFMLIIVLIVMLVKEGKKNQKEFEAEQAKNPQKEEIADPLDAPINLNPMLRSENEYTFVVSTDAEQEKQDETSNSAATLENGDVDVIPSDNSDNQNADNEAIEESCDNMSDNEEKSDDNTSCDGE